MSSSTNLTKSDALCSQSRKQALIGSDVRMGAFDFPNHIQIDPYDGCNERCLYCGVHNPASNHTPNNDAS